MNRSRSCYLIAAFVLTLCLAVIIPPLPVLADGTTVEVNSGTPVIINEGATSSDIPITIKNIPNMGAGNGVGAFTFKLTWNTYVMSIDAITPSNITGWGIQAGTPDNTRGQATITGFTGGNYLIGNATVATLTITGLSSTQGSGAIIMEILSLSDKNGITIAAAPINGQVRVTKASSTPPGGAATPVTTYTLNIAVNGGGTVNPSPGTYSYPSGTVVNLTATPSAGAQFIGWTGDVANPTSPTIQITMNASKSVTANFSTGPATYSLTILVSGQGTVNPPAGSYLQPAGTTIELRATAAPGWRFANWSGEVANPASPTTTITINGNKTVTASFIDTSAPVSPPPPTSKPGVTTPSPIPPTTPSTNVSPPASGGLAVWQIVLISVFGVVVLATILYFVLRRFITMRTYRV